MRAENCLDRELPNQHDHGNARAADQAPNLTPSSAAVISTPMNTKKKVAAQTNKTRKSFSAFNQGVIPTIACFNKATVPVSEWGVDLDTLIKAMQEYVAKHVAPVWGTPANLHKSTDFEAGDWAMVFLDDTDYPDASAYHELTPDGLPLSKVFVKTILGGKQSVSVSASHELVEM